MRGNKDGLTKRQLLPSDTAEKFRRLRLDATDAERALWKALREALPHAKFRRQVPIGRYFADFCSHPHRLVIEVDGGQHAEPVEHNAARIAFIEREGCRVLRFWNHDVLSNIDGVLTAIAASFPSSLVGEGAAQRRMRGTLRA